MRRRSVISVLALTIVAVLLAGICYGRSLAYIQAAQERPWDLWIAALKGFEGPVYYVGSDGDFSYFRAGKIY